MLILFIINLNLDGKETAVEMLDDVRVKCRWCGEMLTLSSTHKDHNPLCPDAIREKSRDEWYAGNALATAGIKISEENMTGAMQLGYEMGQKKKN